MLNPCLFCRAECCRTYTITVTIYDIARIAKATKQKTANPESAKTKTESLVFLHEPRLLSYDPDNVFDTTDGYGYYLLGLKSHPCVFLDSKTGTCKIHSSAPLSCRRYPYNIAGKLNTRFCPLPPQLLFRLKGADIQSGQLVHELDLHKKLVKKWNRKPGTKKELTAFIIKTIVDLV